MTVEPNASYEQEAFLDRPMRSPKPSALINIAGVVPWAFEELKPGVNCAVYQLSKHLDLPYEEIQSEMRVISQELYGDDSVTPRIVIRRCQQRGLSCYYFALNQLHSKSLAESHAKSIACSWFDNHCYLYESARWCSHMEPKPIRPPRPQILHCNVSKPLVTFDGLYEGNRPDKWYSHCLEYERRNLL